MEKMHTVSLDSFTSLPNQVEKSSYFSYKKSQFCMAWTRWSGWLNSSLTAKIIDMLSGTFYKITFCGAFKTLVKMRDPRAKYINLNYLYSHVSLWSIAYISFINMYKCTKIISKLQIGLFSSCSFFLLLFR
jgi:hypothetical protein